MEYLKGVLTLFDDTLTALLSVDIFAVFLAGFLLASAFGLFRMMMQLTNGSNRRK